MTLIKQILQYHPFRTVVGRRGGPVGNRMNSWGYEYKLFIPPSVWLKVQTRLYFELDIDAANGKMWWTLLRLDWDSANDVPNHPTKLVFAFICQFSYCWACLIALASQVNPSGCLTNPYIWTQLCVVCVLLLLLHHWPSAVFVSM